MKTRCQSSRLVAPVIIASMLATTPANAQFNKYRSQTSFNDSEDAMESDEGAGQPPQDFTTITDLDTMTEEEAQAALEAAERNADPNSNFIDPNDAEEVIFDSAASDEPEDEANKRTFGNRPSTKLAAQPKNQKYVNLNPETAFGPEIVESFDFPDTDIMEITKHMQKLTGINLILDKDVKGKVSIIAPTPITVGDAWKAYLAALNMAGYSLVKSGAFYKVINAREIRYTPTKIYTGNYTPDTENYVMRVISLKHVSAAEIARNFRPFMSRYGRIIDIKQTNTIIIADTGSNINRLAKMVKFLDVPGHEDSLQIVRVKNSSAQEIAKLLDNILKGGSSSGAGGAAARQGNATPRFTPGGGSGETTSSISKIIAEPRTNSIIAMANAEGAKQLRDLISKLDVKLVSSSSNRVHVYYLNYGDSEELSKTLQSIVTGATQSRGTTGTTATRFSTASAAPSNPIFSAEVKITSDKNNNALVVTASPTDWLTLKDVISRLDIPRDQVYVEGLILEANISKLRSFGVEYAGAYGNGNIQRAGLTNQGTSDILNLLTTGVPTALGGFFAGVGIGPTRTIKAGTGSSSTTVTVNAVNAFIKAIANHTSTNVLATPQILALDNTEATFEVGETSPIQNSTVSSGGVQSFSTTQQEAKLSLKITPQINKVTRFVKLKINQKIDDFIDTGTTSTSGGRPTTTRSAITEVMVRDRDTVAMGGLLRDRETISSNKVPLLGDIPVLGWLFKNKSRTLTKVNLLFFMTPKIIAPYNATASQNTKDVLDKRNAGMAEMFTGDEVDPSKKLSNELNAKLDRQIMGPLYDEESASQYRNLNEEDIRSQHDDEDWDVPNYQEIIREKKAQQN
ncbi:MAG TPA: type II secretion system secretin GspD [Bacteriovoracaceae bacterium]|nr:type II secretion system secretin GspD [Bacteriovoracaceae bacterium]